MVVRKELSGPGMYRVHQLLRAEEKHAKAIKVSSCSPRLGSSADAKPMCETTRGPQEKEKIVAFIAVCCAMTL